MVTLLRLTDSDDLSPSIATEDRAIAVAERTFEERIGERLATEVRFAWPTPRMAEVAGRWLAELQPDIVLLRVGGFPFTWESVPLRVERLLGPVGRPLARAGTRAMEIPAFARSRVLRMVRLALLRTLGGDTHFTVQAGGDAIEACIRKVLSDERAVLAVRAPHAAFVETGPAARERAESRCGALRARLEVICRASHIEYLAEDPGDSMPASSSLFQPDGLHASVELHRLRGIAEGELLARAWLKAQHEGERTTGRVTGRG